MPAAETETRGGFSQETPLSTIIPTATSLSAFQFNSPHPTDFRPRVPIVPGESSRANHSPGCAPESLRNPTPGPKSSFSIQRFCHRRIPNQGDPLRHFSEDCFDNSIYCQLCDTVGRGRTKVCIERICLVGSIEEIWERCIAEGLDSRPGYCR